MDLKELRKQIDRVDDELVKLLEKRLGIAAVIAGYKKQNNLPVKDEKREAEKIEALKQKAVRDHTPYIEAIYRQIIEQSCELQERIINPEQES